MLEEKYIGLTLAISSSALNGLSFVITKKGLIQAEERHGFDGDGFVYLKSPMWWAGITTHAIAEFFNFAAYAFAPAILVTPLGALSVLIGAILGSYILNERLGTLGRLGSVICLLGAVLIILHAPPDEDIQTIDQILDYTIQPGFLFYLLFVAVFIVLMSYKIAPAYGRTNPLIYLSICSTAGSLTVISVKASGIALKLTFAGNNQFSHPSTYIFIALSVVCILTQMNYFNKALAHFPTNIVNPLYYVTFTTATLCASFILFQGFNTSDPVNTLSLLSGFLVTFAGVYLLNLSSSSNGHNPISSRGNDTTESDMASSMHTSLSLQARRSLGSHHGDTIGLMRAYGEEERAGG